MNTDYLIVGSGAVGMAFADTLLDESDAHITIVDRHATPGGHWNDAYSFVALHQPSAYYGVNSTELGSRRKDDSGPNSGMYELAGGPEITTYFDKVMQHKLLPSGRVSYHPMSDYLGNGRFVSLLSGAQTQVTVRKKTVDATWFSPSVPSTHTPSFTVADGVRRPTVCRSCGCSVRDTLCQRHFVFWVLAKRRWMPLSGCCATGRHRTPFSGWCHATRGWSIACTHSRGWSSSTTALAGRPTNWLPLQKQRRLKTFF
jgi:hypothetical protein